MQSVRVGTAWGARLCALLALCSTNCGEMGDVHGHASSDGLVFIREVGESSDLMWVSLSDGSERALTTTPEHNERWPYWSSRAGRLVVQVEPVGGGNSDLLLWDPADGHFVALRESGLRDERWPTWSPIDDSLVYAFRGPGPRAGIAAESMSAGTTRILAFSAKSDFFFRPSFSADGSRLVAQRRGPDGTGSNLWILAVGRLPQRLTSDPEFFDMKPRFTRHGDHVVFSRRPADGHLRDTVLIALESGSTRTIASQPDSDDHSAQPSPTRDEIAFSSDRNGNYAIFLADLEGDSVRQVTHWNDRNAAAPRWSPDGERLVLTVNAVDVRTKSVSNSHLVVIDREGRIELDIPGAMADWMPAW